MKAYPLHWPNGWRRTKDRKEARFLKKTRQYSQTGSYLVSGQVSIAEGTKRVLEQLRAFKVEEGDAIISTNLKLRLDGMPKGDQKEPDDPGVAIYWKQPGDKIHKVMAIDLYDRVADNLAAIAATLDAMRSIDRHGGATILERAFIGFISLPAPNTWRDVMAFDPSQTVTLALVTARYRDLCKQHHPDVGGSEAKMKELNWAMQEAEKELG